MCWLMVSPLQIVAQEKWCADTSSGFYGSGNDGRVRVAIDIGAVRAVISEEKLARVA